MRRVGLMALLLAGAVFSFALAVWSAVRGRIPIVEMAHAVLFTLIALVVAAAPEPSTSAACRECGTTTTPGIAFCTGCGRVPRIADPRRAPH